MSQTDNRKEERKAPESSSSRTSESRPAGKDEDAIQLLKAAEDEAAALDGRMRAWVLWQIGMAYQPADKAKSLKLYEAALNAAHAVREDSSAVKSRPDPVAWMTGRPSLSPGLRLEADIARSIVLLEPKLADQVLQQVAPAARTGVLVALLAHQEQQQHFDQARETLNRITAEDEMPYDHAMRLIDNLKPEQYGELAQLFSAALSSYRAHGPHPQQMDMFPAMLNRYWKRLPKEVARQAIDEIVKQAADADQSTDPDKRGSYRVRSEKGSVTLSLYEYRLSQILPALRELDPSAARSYLEKNPAIASTIGVESPDAQPSQKPGGPSFHPTGGYGRIMVSMNEMPSAQKAAAKADESHMDEAIADAVLLNDPGLRAQTYEYIAYAAAKKQDSAAARALERMLQATEKLPPKEAFPFYSSAAQVYTQMNQIDDAKESVEAGLAIAEALYKTDSDDDDPNTAPKAFWPSTDAYCAMLRAAARVSHTWAISLLPYIKDPEVKVAAETALAAGWLNAPAGPKTVVVTKKSSNSSFFSGRE